MAKRNIVTIKSGAFYFLIITPFMCGCLALLYKLIENPLLASNLIRPELRSNVGMPMWSIFMLYMMCVILSLSISGRIWQYFIEDYS